jgi:alkyl hydroperoxide reductase subunit AhpF
VMQRDMVTLTAEGLAAKALYVFIGAHANTGWLRGAIELDESGFVRTSRELSSGLDGEAWRETSRGRYLLETSLPGVFAAGDVRSGSVKRVASAVGKGPTAVRLAANTWPLLEGKDCVGAMLHRSIGRRRARCQCGPNGPGLDSPVARIQGWC